MKTINVPKIRSWKENFTFYDLNKICPEWFPKKLIPLCCCFENHETCKTAISIKKSIIKEMLAAYIEDKIKSTTIKNFIYENVRFKIDFDNYQQGFYTFVSCSDEMFEKIKNEIPKFTSKSILYKAIIKIVEPCLIDLKKYTADLKK